MLIILTDGSRFAAQVIGSEACFGKPFFERPNRYCLRSHAVQQGIAQWTACLYGLMLHSRPHAGGSDVRLQLLPWAWLAAGPPRSNRFGHSRIYPGLLYFLNWVDETPRDQLRKQLQVEVNLALIGRLPGEQASEPTTPLARQLAASIRLAEQRGLA
jgi:hypothetical protein